MAKKRPSPIALVQAYFDDGVGAESTSLLADVAAANKRTQSEPISPTLTPPLAEASRAPSHETTDGTSHVPLDAPLHATSDDMSYETPDATYNEASHVTTDETSDAQLKSAERQTERGTNRQTPVTDTRTTSRHSSHQNERQTPPQTERNTLREPSRQTDRLTYHSDPIMTLTVRQGMCLYYLLQRPDYIAQRHTMGNALNLPLPTIRDCITVLVRERFISKPQKIVIRSFQGFTYRLADEDQCARFMRLRGEEFANAIERHTMRATPRVTERMTLRNTETMSNVTYDGPSDVSPSFSSSRKEDKLTTTENRESESVDLLRDPELGYWREKGVNSRQLNAWSDEFQMPVDQVIQSLKYCRYEMVVLNQEEEKQIAKPDNWFYKIMQRSGVYPRPANYKSLAEIRAEQMEQAARELAEARQRQVAAEQELAFQKIMENHASEEYQALFLQVSEFAREMGGKALETAMREAFKGN